MNAKTQTALTTTTDNPVAIADGWDAQANDSAASAMKGSSIKFESAAYFIGREKTLIQPDRQFVAIDIREGWLFLKKGLPRRIRDAQSVARSRRGRPASLIRANGRTDSTASQRIHGSTRNFCTSSILSPPKFSLFRRTRPAAASVT
jgi:hypothetical protein